MTDHKDARQLLADITAGLEGVTPGPWLVKTHDQWEAGFDFFEGPDGAFCFYVDLEEPDAAHIARCNPHVMQTIDREFTALTLELAAANQRIAELEAERQWQPIETAPKDGTLICICCFKAAAAFKHFEGVARIDKWDANYSGGFGGFNPLTFPATHWMPLPASPHEGTQ